MRVEFSNRDGARLEAELDLPIDAKVGAAVVLAHCFDGPDGGRTARLVGLELVRQGFAVLALAFRGSSDDEAEATPGVCASNRADLVDAARYLEREYAAPAVLIGHSLAGTAAVLAASDLESVRAVALIGAPFDVESVSGTPGGGDGAPPSPGARLRDDLSALRAEDRFGALGRALLVMHAPTDEVVPVDQAARIFRAARHPRSFISLDGADHRLTSEVDARFAGSVLAAWAARYAAVEHERDSDLEPHDHRVTVRIGRDRFRTEVRSGRHALLADEPEALGGTDAGPTPYDLLIAGMGACVAITIRMYADRKEWPVEGIDVRITHRKLPPEAVGAVTEGRRKVDVIDREITLYGDLDEEQRARLLEISDRCPVHLTCEGTPIIRTVERRPEPSGA